jgi:hypothetical protein
MPALSSHNASRLNLRTAVHVQVRRGRLALHRAELSSAYNSPVYPAHKGLDLMKNLRFALIPVDHEMAVKKRWGKMPLEQIEKRLNDMTKGAVLRADRDIDGELAASVAQDQAKRLYFELTI